MSRTPHVPTRMCMGCGGRAPQPDLLRVSVTAAGALQFASGRRSTGRSGYLHRRPECWDRFAARKGPLRSLGCVADKPKRIALIEQIRSSRAQMG